MSKREYRVKSMNGVGSFAQVRTKETLPILRLKYPGRWHRIGTHRDGFCLYHCDDNRHALRTVSHAVKQCEDYDAWIQRQDAITTSCLKVLIKEGRR